MEQGRLAALAAFDRPVQMLSHLRPYGIYTIPEISFVGRIERELTQAAVPYVVGLARYRELSRSGIARDRVGLLKLLVHAETRCVLGVHIYGRRASADLQLSDGLSISGHARGRSARRWRR